MTRIFIKLIITLNATSKLHGCFYFKNLLNPYQRSFFITKYLQIRPKCVITYDNLSRVTARTVKKLGDNSVVSTETFNYGAARNVTSAPESSFQYDTNNRLISFNENAVSYELISGHRRKYDCKMLEIDRLPLIVRDLSRDEAG